MIADSSGCDWVNNLSKLLQSSTATDATVLLTITTSVVNYFTFTQGTEKALTGESSSSGPLSRCQ